MYYQTIYSSFLGDLTIVCGDTGLVGLWQTSNLRISRGAEFPENSSHPLLLQARNWLDAYFEGQNPPVSSLPLEPHGSEFDRQVWKLLCDVPYGSVITYGALAKAVANVQGRKVMAAQAVGGAVGRNPLFLFIPCHRVVAAGGKLGGYGGGPEMKTALLAHEGVDCSHLQNYETLLPLTGWPTVPAPHSSGCALK